MKISEVIAILEKYKKNHGDLFIYFREKYGEDDWERVEFDEGYIEFHTSGEVRSEIYPFREMLGTHLLISD